MKQSLNLIIAAIVLVLCASNASAAGKGGSGKGGGGKGGKQTSGSGGGGTPTNYGCQVFPAGTQLSSPDGSSITTIVVDTQTCYLCDFTTRICSVTLPESLVGWKFSL